MAFQEFYKNYLNILMVTLFEYTLFHILFLFPVWPVIFCLYLNETLSGSSGTSIISPLSSRNGSSL